MSLTKAIRIDGEGVTGLERMAPVKFVPPTVVDVDGIDTMSDEEFDNLIFLNKVRADVENGTFKPKRILKTLYSSRSKSS